MSGKNSILAKHTAAAQIAGYLFQFRRAVVALSMGHVGDSIAIELLDDVSIRQDNGRLTLEQDKFTSNRNNNVLGDKSHNLINTLTIWLSASQNGELDVENTRFQLATNTSIAEGLVTEISKAKTRQQASQVVEKIASLDTGTEDRRAILDLLSKPGAKDLLGSIIKNTTVCTDDVNDNEFESSLLLETDYHSHRAQVGQALLGWMAEYALKAWSESRPYIITFQQYIDFLGAFKDHLKRLAHRELPPDRVEVATEDVDSSAGMMFVRQMRLIEVDDEQIRDGIIDFWKSSSERFRLSEKGEIIDQDWLDFDNEEVERWKHIFARSKRMRGEKRDVDVGYEIMEETLTSDNKPSLAGVPIQHSYLVRGTYHRLADDLQVGWHPDYKTLLGG